MTEELTDPRDVAGVPRWHGNCSSQGSEELTYMTNSTMTIDQLETLDLAQLADISGAWSWSSFGKSVVKGAAVGAVGGAVAGSFTGPGVLASTGIGAAAGAVSGAVENAGTQFGIW